MESNQCYSITIKYVGARVLEEMCSSSLNPLPLYQTQELTLECLCPWPGIPQPEGTRRYPFLSSKQAIYLSFFTLYLG